MADTATIGHDTQYLTDVVGNVLAKGVAATVAAQPRDPVEYLGTWLTSYVNSLDLEKQYVEQKKDAAAGQQYEPAKERQLQRAAEEEAAKRQQDLSDLSRCTDGLSTLWKTGIEVTRKLTSAGSVYVAVVTEPDEPDATLPEDDVETDDENELATAPAGTDAAAEATEGGEPTGGEAEAAAAATPAPRKRVDYTKAVLSYVAASAGQEFVTEVVLRRPAPPAEEGEEAAAAATAELPPVTFRLLDEQLRTLAVPAVTREPRVTFFRRFPRVGAYHAVAVTTRDGECRAVLCADSLVPEGDGQPFSSEAQDAIWEAAKALGAALDAGAERQEQEIAAMPPSQELQELRQRLHEMYGKAPPAPPAASTKADASEAQDGAPAQQEEGGNTDEAPESAADDLAKLQADMAKLDEDIGALQQAATASQAAVQLHYNALEEIKQSIHRVQGLAVQTLKLSLTPPPATYHVLKAVLLLLGRTPASVSSWRKCVTALSFDLFDGIDRYDATASRDLDVWRQVRAAYKAVHDPAQLEAELPQSHLGALLLLFIKQVRRVSKRSDELQAVQDRLKALEDAKMIKGVVLARALENKAAEPVPEPAPAAAQEADADAEATPGAGEGGGAGDGEEEAAADNADA